ncbi:universal stress protein [Streptomyces sp. NPDC057197]|uniref:universal stress protein n=1 Tax=Streptomyces sp. NPDC057197 TaxID=3346045 RepID=UPI003625843F
MPTPRDIVREPARALAALPGLAEGRRSPSAVRPCPSRRSPASPRPVRAVCTSCAPAPRCDLIVLGRHGADSHLRARPLGDVVRRVTERAALPVLVVPAATPPPRTPSENAPHPAPPSSTSTERSNRT